jgi:hypothetical protein
MLCFRIIQLKVKNCIVLRAQIYLLPTDLEVGRRMAAAMLILLRIWLSNEKIRLEFGETEILADLPRH